jgi:hypothetical protein
MERTVKRLKLSDLDKILVSRFSQKEPSLDPDNHLLKTLVMLYRLRFSTPIANVLTRSDSLRSLFAVLARSQPRTQLLVIRLLRELLPQLDPSSLSNLSSSIVVDFLDQIGSFFVPSPEQLEQQQQLTESLHDSMEIDSTTQQNSNTSTWIVRLYQLPGLGVDDIAAIIEAPLNKLTNGGAATGRDSSVRQACVNIALQAQETGKAVAYTGDSTRASSLALELASLGFRVELIEMIGSPSPTNLSIASSNPKRYKSGATVFGTAAELVQLIRSLATSERWRAVILEAIENSVARGKRER